ncbi:granzyme G-like [Tympanuchus pallidicinctus]|uniref:granzyme G-like n=1 Tax=Tympanuchus pallidicinctus TaxID=109042 RepID=UPI002286D910|nr:granzyme G-like [Tympanuchus pallidicinctus]
MQHPQRLLLTILLLAGPLDTAGRSWSRLDQDGRAVAQSRPYMAYLRGRDGGFCGGFLVAPGWVMTAAQCFSHRPLTVILGARDIQREEESWQELQVQKYHCHPKYRRREEGHDILLLELKSKAIVNDRVRPISFPNTRFPGGLMCSVAGWGHGASNTALCEANVTVSKQRDCLPIYLGLADHVLCAKSSSNGVPDKSYTGCPLVCNNRAYGIYSYPYRQPMSFYTDISPYLPWINHVMKS